MRIALINENSQASKNKIIYDALIKTNKDNEIINYSDENTNLTQQKDLLLPRLMSGKILI